MFFGSCLMSSTPALGILLTNVLQALESGSPSLSARFFLLLTSSFAGLANPAVTTSEAERTKFLKSATRWAERGREGKLQLELISPGDLQNPILTFACSFGSYLRLLGATRGSDHESRSVRRTRR
jgi:hypothetical protein